VRRSAVVTFLALAVSFLVGPPALAADPQPTGTITLSVQDRADGAIPKFCAFVVAVTGRPAPLVSAEFCNWGYGENVPVLETVTSGPLQVRQYRIFVSAWDFDLGAQWLGINGGTGQPELAAVIDVQPGANSAPMIKLDPAGYIQGNVIGMGNGGSITVNAGGLTPGHYGSCNPAMREVDCVFVANQLFNLRLGPYAWQVEAHNKTGHAWSGGATTRRNAQLVQVQIGKVTRYDLTLRTGGQFTVVHPAYYSWRLETFDAVTGDPGGVLWPGVGSDILNRPLLLRMAYKVAVDQPEQSCWVFYPQSRRTPRTGIFYAGFAGQSPTVTVEPGTTCLSRMPTGLKARRTHA